MALLSSGKLANLLRLADAGGRFKMLAIDQRDSLRNALGKAAGREPADITYEDTAATKALITESLAPYSTATLVDPARRLPEMRSSETGDIDTALEPATPRGPAARLRDERLGHRCRTAP